jgi:hypothetical protein
MNEQIMTEKLLKRIKVLEKEVAKLKNELIDALKGKKLLDENFDIYEDDEE